MTAVEWLVEQLDLNVFEADEEVADVIEKAKAMEKEQIKDAFDECGMWQDNYSDSEHYYKQTFKSE
jgi:hypothetical protein